MRVIGPATENDMVKTFRDAEPSRWRDRGYPDDFLFTGFPRDCEWAWVSFTQEELRNVRQIRTPTWLKIAGPLRLPATAAAWVQSHPDDETATSIRATHAHL